MKKALAMILALAMVLSLAACGAKTETPAAQPAATQAAEKADDTAAATGIAADKLKVGLILVGEAADKTGCSTLAQVFEKKIPCRFVAEPVGSSDYVSFMYLLDIHGVTVEDIESWGGSVTFTDGSACCDMLQDGQADMMVGHTVSTSSSLTELCMSAKMVVSGLTDDEIAGMCERGYAEAPIPAGSFGQTTEEMKSACQASSKIVPSDMEDDLAYAMTKILVENADKLSEDVAGYRGITYADMVDFDAMVVPMHPGAMKYFQDIGVLDADGNYTGK